MTATHSAADLIAAARELASRSRTAQGLSPTVEDPDVLARVAAAIRGADR